MDKKLVKNYIYNIAYQIVKLFLPFFLVKYTYAHIGESTLGINDFASNISQWFILLGVLGVNTYGNREIAKVRDNREELSRNFFEILSMQFINMMIVTVLYLGYTVFFVKDYKIIYYLICLSMLSSAFDISWFYYGVEDFKIVSIRNIIVKLVGVLLIFSFVKTPSDLWIFTLINSGTDFLGQIATFFGLKKHIDKAPFSIKQAYKKHFAGTFALFVPTIAINVYTLLDQTLLGTFVDDKGQLNLYKTSQSFVKMFLYFVTSIGAVVMPRIANVFNKSSNKDEVSGYINTTFKLAIILSLPIFVALEVVSEFFYPWYTPKQANDMILLVRLLSPIIIFISLSNVFGIQYLVPTNNTAKYTKSIIAGAVVNMAINLYTIPRWAAVGACIGSVCAEFTVTLVQWLYMKDEIKLSAFDTTVKSIISAFVMGAVIYFVGTIFGAKIYSNALQAASGMIVYAFMLYILKEPTVVNTINKIVFKKA